MSILLQEGKTWVREDSDQFFAEREAHQARQKMNPLKRLIRWFVFSA